MDVSRLPERIIEAWCKEYIANEFDDDDNVKPKILIVNQPISRKTISMSIKFNYNISIDTDYYEATGETLKAMAKELHDQYYRILGVALRGKSVYETETKAETPDAP